MAVGDHDIFSQSPVPSRHVTIANEFAVTRNAANLEAGRIDLKLRHLSKVINEYAVSYSCLICWVSNLERHEPAVS